MVIVWRLRGNIIRTAPCWVVRHNVHSQQHTHVSSSYRSSRLGLSHWDPYAMHSGGCHELYYCNMVDTAGWIQALSARPTGFLQCFDTVGFVIWPVKIVPEMTYNVLSGTFSLYTNTTTKPPLSVLLPSLFGQVALAASGIWQVLRVWRLTGWTCTIHCWWVLACLPVFSFNWWRVLQADDARLLLLLHRFISSS